MRHRAAAGPCPYVKILYDAARYVELTGDRVASTNVAYTGENLARFEAALAVFEEN